MKPHGHGPTDPLLQELETLKNPMMGRRCFSWLFFLPLLVFLLLTPIAFSLYPECVQSMLTQVGLSGATQPARMAAEHSSSYGQAKGKSQDVMAVHAWQSTPLAVDRWWSTGPMSSGHAPWANDCKACHTQAFTMVKDKDCLACHEKIGNHLDPKQTPVEDLAGMRCASCHRDHMGSLALKDQNIHYTGTQCGACHQDIKQSAPKSETLNVADFKNEHPQFRVQIATGIKAGDVKRVRLMPGQTLTEHTNLKFPHDVHVDKAGIQGPKGRVTMACADCHQPDSTGVNFLPVTMKDHCQACHELRFEPGLSNRQVPHGSVEDVLNTLREAYSFIGGRGTEPPRPSAMEIAVRARPGQESETASAPRAAAKVLSAGGLGAAQYAARELFEKTSCVVCHEVSRVPGPGRVGTSGRDLPQYAIAPIRPDHAWMPKAKFDHKAHRNESCGSCHDAKHSAKATDVLMPAIEGCRDCHVGSQPVANKVKSDCGLCHGFHLDAHDQPWPKPEQQASLWSQFLQRVRQ